MAERITADDARRLSLRAQGLLGAPDRRGGVPAMLRRVAAVQLDTISVLARSHELVAYARLGPVGRPSVEAAYWGRPPQAFEYWAHVASILPIEDWPWFARRRRREVAEDAARLRDGVPAAYAEVRARLADGPATASELGGAKRGGEWWDWSDTKIAVERLLRTGEVVCVERRGWKRVYDLAERAIPAELRAVEPSDEECAVRQVDEAGRCLGVATRADLADYFRLPMSVVDVGLAATSLLPVEVAGWEAPAWADPAALDALRAGTVRGRHRTTLLSPFDSLIWHRDRTERVFGFYHRLEAYVPKPNRVHGYFAMPVLAGGRIVGRVDPKRVGRTLVAQQMSVLRPAAVDSVAEAVVEAATWVGCDAVALERVDPPELRPALEAAVRARS